VATYSGAQTQHQTLTASTVDTVTLDGNYDQAEVVNRATSGDIYWTVNGSTPTAGGAGTFITRAGEALKVRAPEGGQTVVKLISTAACPYSVTGI
jgi:hypothetical protein